MTPEEVISPWRAAKPRKPLREFQSPRAALAPASSKPSPPNSEHKESTRMDTPSRHEAGEDEVDLTGASPAFLRSGDLETSKIRGNRKEEKVLTMIKPKPTMKSSRSSKYSEDESEAEVNVKLRLTLNDRLQIRRAMMMSSRPANADSWENLLLSAPPLQSAGKEEGVGWRERRGGV